MCEAACVYRGLPSVGVVLGEMWVELGLERGRWESIPLRGRFRQGNSVVAQGVETEVAEGRTVAWVWEGAVA